MVTVAGMDTALELEESDTIAPPEGAAGEICTVPVTAPPLATEFCDKVTARPGMIVWISEADSARL